MRKLIVAEFITGQLGIFGGALFVELGIISRSTGIVSMGLGIALSGISLMEWLF